MLSDAPLHNGLQAGQPLLHHDVGKPRLIVRADLLNSKERTLIAYDVAVLLGQLLHEFDLAVHHACLFVVFDDHLLDGYGLAMDSSCVDA